MEQIKQIVASAIRGAFGKGVMQMVLIFILAGIFAGLADNIGAVDAAVQTALILLPGSMIYAGIFITSMLISFSLGTSMGTIAAVAPVACGIAADTEMNLPFVMGIIVGGAFFGDNLSFISDTTLAATRTMGVKMKDKFLANIRVVLPAVVITLAIYLVAGYSQSIEVPQQNTPEVVRLIPYILVIALALCGVSVNKVLSTGILGCIAVGYYTGSADASSMLDHSLAGIMGMKTVIIVAIIAGGVVGVIKQLGWLDRFTDLMTSKITTKRGAMASIAVLTAGTNCLTANNTVAILSVGPIARTIAIRYELDRRQCAGVMDMFSCLVQSLIPYGAQLLLVGGLTDVSPFSVIPWLFYPFLMGLCAMISVVLTKD